MTPPGEFANVARKLEELNIPYALSGSLASTTWGEPRATYDPDFVIDLKRSQVDLFVDAFPAQEWYVEKIAIVEAIDQVGEFNLIHAASGTKIDFWLRAKGAADLLRFQRRRRERVVGVECWLLSPEDTILAKLEWMKAAPSDRQMHDVQGILAVQGTKLDADYLREWADRLEVRALLQQALEGKPQK